MHHHIRLGGEPRDCFAVAMTLMSAAFYTIIVSAQALCFIDALYEPLIP